MYQFLFDFDGTLTRKELLPEIGVACGLEVEIGRLTELTIAGHIPFQRSLEYRVELLKRVPVSTVQEIVRNVPLYDRLVRFIRDNSSRCHVITGNLDVWIGPLCRSICPSVLCSEAIIDGDQLIGLRSVLDKATTPLRFDGPIVAIGEGHADAGLFDRAEIGIAFGQTHEPAKSVLEVCTHLVYDEQKLCEFLQQLL
jgi:phosphoserine phosphatase